MRDLNHLKWHKTAEEIAQALMKKTQNSNPQFFRMMTSYYITKVASMMRCSVLSLDEIGHIPVNGYVINMAISGDGKGHAQGLFEDMILNQFQDNYLNHTFEIAALNNQANIANKRAKRKGTDPDDELTAVENDFRDTGEFLFSFDGGTEAAIKQMRNKLLMADCGAMCLEIDEIGSHLEKRAEVLTLFLELYDQGKTKNKLIKNSAENKRLAQLDGKTPACALLFGTPATLLDDGKTEEKLRELLETGYARRTLFGYSPISGRNSQQTSKERLAQLRDKTTTQFIDQISAYFGQLADPVNLNRVITIPEPLAEEIVDYQLHCEREANKISDRETIRKVEMIHRWSKALKLAGAYAFIDGSGDLTPDQWWGAVKIVEDSANALDRIITRDPDFVKLAKFIADAGSNDNELTHAEIMQALPSYKGASSVRKEMLEMAISWGYKNNCIIKKSYDSGVELLSGETLKETDLSQIIVSYSKDIATGYRNECVPWSKLHMLTQAKDHHWVNHHLNKGHRREENAEPGFNMVVIDVDHGCSLDTAKMLLDGYKALYYTTKRHQIDGNGDRFRIILPIQHELKLNKTDFKQFMRNIYAWLPFEVDEVTDQRARKWMSHNGHHEYTDGKLLDVLDFIPRTKKSQEHEQSMSKLKSMTGVERWFAMNIKEGNRNNQMHRYARMLVDDGKTEEQVRDAVLSLNSKLVDKMDEAEILSTIMVTAGRAIAERDAKSA